MSWNQNNQQNNWNNNNNNGWSNNNQQQQLPVPCDQVMMGPINDPMNNAPTPNIRSNTPSCITGYWGAAAAYTMATLQGAVEQHMQYPTHKFFWNLCCNNRFDNDCYYSLVESVAKYAGYLMSTQNTNVSEAMNTSANTIVTASIPFMATVYPSLLNGADNNIRNYVGKAAETMGQIRAMVAGWLQQNQNNNQNNGNGWAAQNNNNGWNNQNNNNNGWGNNNQQQNNNNWNNNGGGQRASNSAYSYNQNSDNNRANRNIPAEDENLIDNGYSGYDWSGKAHREEQQRARESKYSAGNQDEDVYWTPPSARQSSDTATKERYKQAETMDFVEPQTPAQSSLLDEIAKTEKVFDAPNGLASTAPAVTCEVEVKGDRDEETREVVLSCCLNGRIVDGERRVLLSGDTGVTRAIPSNFLEAEAITTFINTASIKELYDRSVFGEYVVLDSTCTFHFVYLPLEEPNMDYNQHQKRVAIEPTIDIIPEYSNLNLAITEARKDLVEEAVLESGEVAVPALIDATPVAVPSIEFGEALMIKDAVMKYGEFDGYVIARRLDVVKPLILSQDNNLDALRKSPLFNGTGVSSFEDIIRALGELSIMIDHSVWWTIHNELTDNMNVYLRNELLVDFQITSIYEDAPKLVSYLRDTYGNEDKLFTSVVFNATRVAARVFNFVEASDNIKGYFKWEVETEAETVTPPAVVPVEEAITDATIVEEPSVSEEAIEEAIVTKEIVSVIPNIVCRAEKYSVVVLPWKAAAMGIDLSTVTDRSMKVSTASNPVLAEAIKNVLTLSSDISVTTILVTADHCRFCVAKSPLTDTTYFLYQA